MGKCCPLKYIKYFPNKFYPSPTLFIYNNKIILVLYSIVIYNPLMNITHDCKYHIVWCVKYRRKVLTDIIKKRLEALIIEKAKDVNANILELEIYPDYVHILIQADPKIGIHKSVKYLKANTSSILRKEFKELTTRIPTLWTNTYYVSTLGDLSLKDVTLFLESQSTSQRK